MSYLVLPYYACITVTQTNLTLENVGPLTNLKCPFSHCTLQPAPNKSLTHFLTEPMCVCQNVSDKPCENVPPLGCLKQQGWTLNERVISGKTDRTLCCAFKSNILNVTPWKRLTVYN